MNKKHLTKAISRLFVWHSIFNLGNMGINRENVRSFAAFILYGAVGTIYNDYIIKGENKTNSSEAFGIISELFQRPQ